MINSGTEGKEIGRPCCMWCVQIVCGLTVRWQFWC